MGKLLHKWVHGVVPSWLLAGFRRTNFSSKKVMHSRLRHGIHLMSGKSSAPTLPSSPPQSNEELADLLMDMDQDAYYYSQSEDEQERPITGNSNHMSSLSVESKIHDKDDDYQIRCGSHNPKMGICALAAACIIKGRWDADKDKPPPSPSEEIQYPTSPASTHLQHQQDSDDHQQYNQQEGCLNHSCPLQHQSRELTRSSRERMKKDEHDNAHCGHGLHQQHQHQPLHDKNHQQPPAAGGQAHGYERYQPHAENRPDHNQHSQHHACDGFFCKHNAHHYHYSNHDVSEYQHHAGDGSLCQQDDDDDVYHRACRKNNVYKYPHHLDDGTPCMHDRSEYHHHANDGHDRSLCQHDDNVYYHKNHRAYDGKTYGSDSLLHISKHGRTKPNMGSHTITSLAKNVKNGTQYNYGHHHFHHGHGGQCQNDNQHHQYYASSINYHQPHFGGFKRKSFCLDENDGNQDGKDENTYQCCVSPWPCVKRQKTHEGSNIASELPECISERLGDGCAVVRYTFQNPQLAFRESMVQMIVGNELCSRNELEFLLHCYLALNDPHLQHTICTSFLQVLKDLQQSLLLWASVDKATTI